MKQITLMFIIVISIVETAMGQKDDIKIVIRNNKNYIDYVYNDSSKEILIPYPFDTAILEKTILCVDKNNNISKCTSFAFDNVLMISLGDFNFSNKQMLFFIDESKNKMISIKRPDGIYLETGLPYFIVSNNGDVVTSNTLSFSDSSVEKTLVHYYKIENGEIKWYRDKVKYFSEKDMDEETFTNRRFIKSFFQR